MPSPAVVLQGVSRSFQSPNGNTYVALQGIDLSIPAASFVSIVGPSGCGKSTLLNIIAGLSTPTSGTVEILGRPLAGLNRDAAYMFQQDALLPWKNVFDNVSLGLELRGVARGEIHAKASEWLQRVGLEKFAHNYPHQLSGGMRKRAAMAQVFLTDPAILLMDEPFSALDVHTRHKMEAEALQLWSGSGKTAIFVTHDLEEAIALSDEVVILSAGPASHIIGKFTVELPRPRNLLDMKTDSRFHEIYGGIWSTLRQEVLKANE